MTAAEFGPLVRAADLLGLFGLVAILIVCWVIFPSLLYVANRRTQVFPPWEHWLAQPIMFLVMWYLLATAVDQIRHGPYVGSTWPSSFVASALFASTLLIIGFRKASGARWFFVIAFIFSMLVFGLFLQLVSWFLPRYATILLGLF